MEKPSHFFQFEVSGSLLALFVLAGALLFAAGCATPESNPPTPRPNFGYADFYADPPLDGFWKVDERNAQRSEFRVLYSEYKAPTHGVLRLELSPGRHRLRLALLNLATEGPVEVELEIVDQKITPVRVNLGASGSTYVREVEDKARDSGRRRKATDSQHQVFKLTPEVGVPQNYLPKGTMRGLHSTLQPPKPPLPPYHHAL